jgi:16S rRNA (guanine527-N7)-methyltransferase
VSEPAFRDALIQRFHQVSWDPDPDLVTRLEVYHRLLLTWSRRINLTGLDLTASTPEVLDRLFVEPVLAARYARPGAASLLDIGSGGGSPAVPLALAVPGARLTMVESRVKKSVFLAEVCRGLGLAAHWRVITSRFEDLVTGDPSLRGSADLLSIRAVRVDSATLLALQTFLRPGGQLFLFQSLGTPSEPVAGLEETGVHALVESMKSELRILEKPRAIA